MTALASKSGVVPRTFRSGAAAPTQVRLRTLTLIRWVAVAGQAITLLVVDLGLDFPLPLGWALATVGVSAILNIVMSADRPRAARLGERAAAGLLAFDVCQLAALLFLTGGLTNPFAFLLLAPVTVSATILSLRSTIALSFLALACITGLAMWHLPLPWDAAPFQLPRIYVFGSWVALCLGIAFFSAYTWRVAQEERRMSGALAATQHALAREQQASALGGLAAAAAHQLGTPLGTIAVIAREIDRELPSDNPVAEDVKVLIGEVERCREILAELARRPEGDAGSPYERLPFDALVEAAAAAHANDLVELRLEAHAADGAGAAPPTTLRSPEIIHGIGNLAQNAIQFARRAVVVETVWDDEAVVVSISDDGPGFAPGLLERLGEPYTSGRAASADHMGLGIFIARTLLERSGATVGFANRPGGGAQATIYWRRAIIEAAARPAGADQ